MKRINNDLAKVERKENIKHVTRSDIYRIK